MRSTEEKHLRLAKMVELLLHGVELLLGVVKVPVELLPGVELLVIHLLGVVRQVLLPRGEVHRPGVTNLVMEAHLHGLLVENPELHLRGVVVTNPVMEVLLPGVVPTKVVFQLGVVAVTSRSVQRILGIVLPGVTIKLNMIQEKDLHGVVHPNNKIVEIDLHGVIKAVEVLGVEATNRSSINPRISPLTNFTHLFFVSALFLYIIQYNNNRKSFSKCYLIGLIFGFSDSLYADMSLFT